MLGYFPKENLEEDAAAGGELTLAAVVSSFGGRILRIENTTEGFERYKFTRERLSGELMYRRERQWKVFSWVSSLFLTIIGGVIALSSSDLILATLQKASLTGVVLVFALFALLRITHDISVAEAYSRKCFKLDEILELEFNDKSAKKRHIRHRGFLIMLAVVTVSIVWFVPLIQ
jgi:hypothetical protein